MNEEAESKAVGKVEPETYEAIRHYSSLCGTLRLLLLTQAYIWLSAIAYFPLKVLDAQANRIAMLATWAIALIAALCTVMLDVIHGNYLDFLMVLIRRAATQVENGDGPWATVHLRRQELSKQRLYLLNHPGLPMVGVFFLTAVAITLVIATH
jgi:hypothetical protein